MKEPLKDCEHRRSISAPNYMVSEYGDVYSLQYERYLKDHGIKLGYRLIHLYVDEKKKGFMVHRLVAECWIPNPENLEQVNHKDEIPWSNHYSNLEWMSREDNMDYSQSGTFYFYNPRGDLVEVFNLQRFCRDNNLSAGNMHMVFDGKRRHHKGWTSAKPKDYVFHKRDDPLYGTKSWGWLEGEGDL